MGITINSEGYHYIAITSLILITALLFEQKVISSIVFLFLVFFLIFFRDPDREIPAEKNIVVSPADGRVLYVKEKKDEKKKIVRIFLSPFDVHINRAPVSGTVASINRFSGKHLPAFSKSSEKNERNEIKINAGKNQIKVTQIVGSIARRIRCWIKIKDKVTIGDRIGMIKFGSGTEVEMPLNYKVLVKKGERVKAGETLIARKTK